MSTSLTLYTLEEELTALLDTVDMVEGDDQRLQILDEIARADAQAVAAIQRVSRRKEGIRRAVAGAGAGGGVGGTTGPGLTPALL